MQNTAPATWGFNGCPVACTTLDGRNVNLTDYLYYTAKDGRQFRVVIGAGSDGLSTPQAGWSIIPPFGKPWRAGVLHDGGYRGQLEIYNGAEWVPCNPTKDEADNLILEAMEWLQVDQHEADIIYNAVRDCGQSSFDQDRKP